MPLTWRHTVCRMVCLVPLAAALTEPAEAARPRRPSASQKKKTQDNVKYLQQDTLRYQQEVAAKQREVFNSFDVNGNGHLEGGEKARFDSYMHAVQQGRRPDPLSAIAPVGQGPRAGGNPSSGKGSSLAGRQGN